MINPFLLSEYLEHFFISIFLSLSLFGFNSIFTPVYTASVFRSICSRVYVFALFLGVLWIPFAFLSYRIGTTHKCTYVCRSFQSKLARPSVHKYTFISRCFVHVPDANCSLILEYQEIVFISYRKNIKTSSSLRTLLRS